MDVVRYRPGEAIRWLRDGADELRRSAGERGRSLVRSRPDRRPIAADLRAAAGAVVGFGRGAYTELLHRQAEASEYVLQDDHFDVVRGGSAKSIPYDEVKRIAMRGDRAELVLDRGGLTVRPFAHLVAGRARVPIGWVRNGVEVPYETLLEELAARCRLEIEEE